MVSPMSSSSRFLDILDCLFEFIFKILLSTSFFSFVYSIIIIIQCVLFSSIDVAVMYLVVLYTTLAILRHVAAGSDPQFSLTNITIFAMDI